MSYKDVMGEKGMKWYGVGEKWVEGGKFLYIDVTRTVKKKKNDT